MDREYQWICDKCGKLNPCPSSGICRQCEVGEIHKTEITREDYEKLSLYYEDQQDRSVDEDQRRNFDRFEQFMKEKYAVPYGYKMKEFDIVDENLDWSMFEKPVEEQLVPFERTPYVEPTGRVNSSLSMKCPYCKSTNVSKVSNLGKVAKVGLFGLLGTGDIGKTWKCNKCGSKW